MKKEILIGLSCLLSGCSLFPPVKEAPPLYILKGAAIEPSSRLTCPITIHTPTSEASLDTSRIAMTMLPYHRNYIENGEWPDYLPKIVQEVLIESLGEKWGGSKVQRTEANLETEYGLFSDIQDFSVYPLECGRSEVRIKMSFKLTDFSERRVITAQSFSEVIPLKTFSVHAIVGAFNEGLHRIVQKVAVWVEDAELRSKKKSRETLAQGGNPL